MNRAMPVLVAGILACVRPPQPPAAEEPLILMTPLGWDVHDTRPSSARDAAANRPAVAPRELRAFALAIDTLRHAPGRREDELVRAIHALADALVLVDPTARAYIAAIHATAERLQDSTKHPREQAELVRVALDRTRSVLARSAPRNRWRMRDYVTSLTRFTDQVTAIDPHRPLVDQRWRVDAAFAAALTTIEVAVGVAAR